MTVDQNLELSLRRGRASWLTDTQVRDRDRRGEWFPDRQAQLFQDFDTVALRKALEGAYGGRVAAEPLNHLDEAARAHLYPNIVCKLVAQRRSD